MKRPRALVVAFAASAPAASKIDTGVPGSQKPSAAVTTPPSPVAGASEKSTPAVSAPALTTTGVPRVAEHCEQATLS